MYRKILVPMALNHDVSPQTLQIAKNLCSPGGEVLALHVHEALQGSVSTYVDEDVVKAGLKNAHDLLIEKIGGDRDVKPVILQGHSARTIIDFAGSNGIDCIVMGSHKPGLSDYFLGSTAARVVRHAPCAVHVTRESI